MATERLWLIGWPLVAAVTHAVTFLVMIVKDREREEMYREHGVHIVLNDAQSPLYFYVSFVFSRSFPT